MDRTGLAPADDEVGVRWVAVRHAADHIHLVATLARQDGARPRIWNDFYRVREACLEAERRFGLSVTAPADRTAARRPARAETEQTARRGWAEAPRTRLRREVCTAAAGARTEQEFFARLSEAGVLVRLRYSTVNPGQVTGYAVGLPDHTAKDGGTIWYGGGKLAADLTLPKVRARWAVTGTEETAALGRDLPPVAARGLLRAAVTSAAEHAPDEAGFFARLRADGVLVRMRFSELNPGEVTGYSVALRGHVNGNGEPVWYGGGRLAAGLSLPRLRRTWSPAGSQRPAHADHHGAARLTTAERNAVLDHAARYAATATEHIRWCTSHDPARAADAAHAAADTLHVAAAVTRSKALRSAADCYDRAARMRYGRTPTPTPEGRQLRAAARMLALTGRASPDDRQLVTLIAKLAALAAAVIELRQAQQHAAQAAAARAAAARLREHCGRTGSPVAWYSRSLAASPAAMGQRPGQAPPVSALSTGQSAGAVASRPRPPPRSAPAGRGVRR
jgi:hypothetical protein